MDEMDKQLKKGVLEIIILKILEEKARYGYELIRELSITSEGYFDMKEGTLYPILYRLNSKGLIENYWGNEENGAARRKYYLLTEVGRRELRRSVSKWQNLVEAVNLIINVEKNEGDFQNG